MADDRQRLIAGEAPPAYSPAAGAVGGGPPAGAVGKYPQPPAGAATGYGTYGTAPNYPAPAQPSYIQQQPQTITVVQQQPSVVVVGGCPACRVGVLEDDFTCLGVLCAIFFFPLGLLCCLFCRVRRCPNCGAVFG